MKTQKKEFTGVWIPRVIIEEETLSPLEKMIYAEIACFEVCYMKNEQLGKRYNRSEKTISTIIGKLKKKVYIKQSEFNGRMRGLIALTDLQPSRQSSQKLLGRVAKNVQADPPKTSTKDNSIDNNKDNKSFLSAHGAEEHFSNPSDKDLPMVKEKKEGGEKKEKTLLEKKKKQEKDFLNGLDKIETVEENEPTPKDISEVISYFNLILPAYFVTNSPFAIPATRKIVKKILNLYTKEQLKDIISKYHAKTRDTYRPSVATVYEFCTKLDKIKSYVEKTSSNLWAHKSISTPEQKERRDIAIKESLARQVAEQKKESEAWIAENSPKEIKQ